MNKKGIIDQIWQLAYTAFEGNHTQSVLPAFAAKSAINELQFRMMRSIAALKMAPQAEVGKHIDAVRGDVLAASAMGWMSVELSDHMNQLLDQL